ncbi:MAG: diguanylate cyclase, partial [Novosphingobium sp.]|nr:diguanylate cyclase [Novosphingobium sp.]
DALFNWWNWWIGDSLGVMVATPLMFVLFGRPVADWRARRAAVIAPLLLAIALLAFAFQGIRHWESLRIQTQFNRDAEHVTSSVRKQLEAQTDMIMSVERFIAVSQHVSRSDFREFVAPWLDRYPGTQNFGWSPFVRHEQRSTFEARIRQDDYPDFQILSRDPEGTTFPAPAADAYFPLTFIEPLTRNRKALGLNPAAFPATAKAIDLSRQNHQPVASDAIQLVQEQQVQRGVVVYLATYRTTATPDGVYPLMGTVSAAFRMDDSMAAAMALADETGIGLCLLDLSAPPDNRRLTGSEQCASERWLDQPIRRAVPIEFANRQWELRLHATPAYLESIRSWAAWASVAVGLLAVGMLGAFLLITTGNTRRIAALVEQRTAELQTATRRLRRQQDALAEAQRIARLGSWETNAGGTHLHGSDELFEILKRTPDTLGTLDDLVSSIAEGDRSRLRRAIRQLSEEPGRAAFDCSLEQTKSCIVHFQIESEWVDHGLHRIRGTVQDVSAEREAEAHIQYLAHFDPLTGLPNRSAWTNQAQAALINAQRNDEILAILFLDLDNFKTVNDSLGHPVGDRLLSAVARRLTGCLREEDLLARVGGDEFVALLPRLSTPEEAAQIAHKLIKALGTPIHIEDNELSTSVSIGISVYPADGNDVDTLLKHADTAMYGAKAAGRNQYEFFVPDMNARAFERLMLETALRRGIERNELVLHYQPQIDARSGRINGCEALVRWNHPDLGLVPPSQFIPIAEDSGLILPLGTWVLGEACRQQARWQASGLGDLLVAINISALQFLKPDFIETVMLVSVTRRQYSRRVPFNAFPQHSLLGQMYAPRPVVRPDAPMLR